MGNKGEVGTGLDQPLRGSLAGPCPAESPAGMRRKQGGARCRQPPELEPPWTQGPPQSLRPSTAPGTKGSKPLRTKASLRDWALQTG